MQDILKYALKRAKDILLAVNERLNDEELEEIIKSLEEYIKCH